MKYFVLLLFAFTYSYSQLNLEKDTLHLEEAVVTNAKLSGRTKSIRYTAFCSHHETLTYHQEFVTLIDKLPAGILQSVYFKFNGWSEKDKHTNYKYKDTDIEIVFYEADEDNVPEKRIAHSPVIVTVPGDFRGRMKIDLSKYKILSPGKIFVGIKRITKNIGKNQEFAVAGICFDEKDRYTSYYRKENDDRWTVSNKNNHALKLELKIALLE
jgi:hypothetical protein